MSSRRPTTGGRTAAVAPPIGRRVARGSLLAAGLALAASASRPLAVSGQVGGATSTAVPGDRGMPRSFASTGVSEDAILNALAQARPEHLRSVGNTSVTLAADLAGPIDAAFKVESPVHPRGWLSEVAAYRVARALGLDDVPPAMVRWLDRGLVERTLDPGSDGGFAGLSERCTFSGNSLRGALIYWVPGLQDADLDTPAGIARWRAWLTPSSPIPPAERALARDLSNVLLFDFVIGNRDRWSGGNVRPVGDRLIIRDHNLSFPSTLPEAQAHRMLATLRQSSRFSRSVVARLQGLDEAALRGALAEPVLGSLLDPRQVAAVLARRDIVLSYIGALVETHGADRVLSFE